MTNVNPCTNHTTANNQTAPFSRAEHPRPSEDSPALTDGLREQAKAALAVALARVLDKFGQESRHRLAILKASGDVALSREGAPWVAEMERQVFPAGDPAKPDMRAARGGFECEALRRLHGETVTICEGLYRAMTAEPGWAAWSERFMEDGPLFFRAKAAAVSRFAGVDMGPLVHESFVGFETRPQLHEALTRLTGESL